VAQWSRGAALAGENETQSVSDCVDCRPYDQTVKLFELTSSSGVFNVDEVLSPTRSEDDQMPTLMPFLQQDLYEAPAQPGLLAFFVSLPATCNDWKNVIVRPNYSKWMISR